MSDKPNNRGFRVLMICMLCLLAAGIALMIAGALQPQSSTVLVQPMPWHAPQAGRWLHG